MFRNAKSPRGWDTDPHIPRMIDSLDGHKIERAVAEMPPKYRTLVRWVYVFPWVSDSIIRRELGLTRAAVCEEINNARDLLKTVL